MTIDRRWEVVQQVGQSRADGRVILWADHHEAETNIFENNNRYWPITFLLKWFPKGFRVSNNRQVIIIIKYTSHFSENLSAKNLFSLRIRLPQLTQSYGEPTLLVHCLY